MPNETTFAAMVSAPIAPGAQTPRLKTAVQQLGRLLTGGRRERKYRHHLFYKKCSVAWRSLQKTRKNRTPASDKEVRERVVAAGRAVVAEMGTKRIDTIALCAGLLGVLAPIWKEYSCADEKHRRKLERGKEESHR